MDACEERRLRIVAREAVVSAGFASCHGRVEGLAAICEHASPVEPTLGDDDLDCKTTHRRPAARGELARLLRGACRGLPARPRRHSRLLAGERRRRQGRAGAPGPRASRNGAGRSQRAGRGHPRRRRVPAHPADLPAGVAPHPPGGQADPRGLGRRPGRDGAGQGCRPHAEASRAVEPDAAADAALVQRPHARPAGAPAGVASARARVASGLDHRRARQRRRLGQQLRAAAALAARQRRRGGGHARVRDAGQHRGLGAHLRDRGARRRRLRQEVGTCHRTHEGGDQRRHHRCGGR